MAVRAVICAAALLVVGLNAASAQWINYPTRSVPRLPDGKADLSAPVTRTVDGRPDLSGLWQPASLTHLRNIMADMRPEDVPLQPWAAAVYEARMAKDDPAARCMPLGLPRAFNNLFKIIQTPETLTVLYEGHSQYRQIFIDGRSLPSDPNPAWFGYSVGRWDGDSLVVDSVGFNNKTWLDLAGHPHSESLHLTERFSRKDFGHLDVQVTIVDPVTYTRPFTVTYPLALAPDTELIEAICENEQQILPRLIGTDLAHPPTRKSIRVDSELLSRYAGTYELAPGRDIVITSAGDRLMMRFPGNPDTLSMFPEATNRFFFTVRDELIEFPSGPDGLITRLLIHSATSDQLAIRRGP